MKSTLLNHLREHNQFNFTMAIHVVFQKACIPEVKTVPPVVLHTAPYTVWPVSDIDGSLGNAAEELFEKIEEYEGNGSGWVIDYLERLDTTISSMYNPSGSQVVGKGARIQRKTEGRRSREHRDCVQ